MRGLALAVCLAFFGCAGRQHAAGPPPNRAILVGEIGEQTRADLVSWVSANTAHGSPSLFLAIESEGGDISAAVEIGHAFTEYGGDITCRTRHAASAAAYLFELCDRRWITDDGYLLFHEAAFFLNEPLVIRPHDIRRMESSLAAANIAIALIISQRLQMDPNEYLERISDGQEWILRGAEAVEANAADAVVPGDSNPADRIPFMPGGL